jgi:hypothetical protein
LGLVKKQPFLPAVDFSELGGSYAAEGLTAIILNTKAAKPRRVRTPAALVCLLALLLAAVPGIQAQQTSNSASVASQAGSAPLTDQEVDKRVNALLQQMTQEEKIGQFTQLPGAAFIPDAPKPEDRIRKGEGGSVLWLSDPASINRLQHVAVEQSRRERRPDRIRQGARRQARHSLIL